MSRSKGTSNRNIYITEKVYAMLAAIDAGIIKSISTNEARARAGRKQALKINARRKAA